MFNFESKIQPKLVAADMLLITSIIEKKIKSLGSLRYSLFSKKQTTPALKKLSPTDNSPKEHVKRARLQVLNTLCVSIVQDIIVHISYYVIYCTK